LKEWQFNILFFVGVGGAIFLLVGPEFGLDINSNPTALAGIGSILTYILTQKKTLTTRKKPTQPKRRRVEASHEEDDDVEGGRIESVYGDPDREENGDER
jgi:hypothetical protein